MSERKAKLGSLLLQYGLISEEDLDEGLKIQKLMGLKLGETLIKIGKITEENVEWILSKQFDIPFIIVEHVEIDNDLIVKLPKEFLLDNRILPLFETDEEICIVTDDIFNYSAFAFIEDTLYKKTNIALGNGEKIEKTLLKYFKKEAAPSLLSVIKVITEKIKNTSFYRIDIMLQEHYAEISIYGCGILKKITKIESVLKKEDVLRTFDSLKIPIIYNVYNNFNRALLSIYPLTNKLSDIKYPAILGINGLILPDDTAFSDMQSSDLPNLLYCDCPVYGYPFLAIKDRGRRYGKIIYTVDSAPEDFLNYHVEIYAPQKCTSCEGAGCNKCNELGYAFQKIKGLLNSDEMKKILGEGVK